MGSLLELGGYYRAALEVNAEIKSLAAGCLMDYRGSQTRQHEQHGYANKPATITQPVDIYVMKDLKHDDSLNTQRLHSLLA
jgi:hypothetical protein